MKMGPISNRFTIIGEAKTMPGLEPQLPERPPTGPMPRMGILYILFVFFSMVHGTSL